MLSPPPLLSQCVRIESCWSNLHLFQFLSLLKLHEGEAMTRARQTCRDWRLKPSAAPFAPLHINATHKTVFMLNSIRIPTGKNGGTHGCSPAVIFSLASTAVVYKIFSLMPASVSPGRRSGSVMGLTHSPPALYSEWRLHVFFFTACVGFSMVIRFPPTAR